MKKVPLCRSMLIDKFLEENGEVGEEEEEEIANEDGEEDTMEQGENALVEEGTSKKKTRGPTRCLKIHARDLEERQETTLDDEGEPIGPNDKAVSELSFFLGTLARNSNFCPLIYTNFKALITEDRDRIWEYINEKFIIPEKGRKAIFAPINDAWRRYKNYIKRKHFLKYSNLRERLKHRPKLIPEPHFRKLMDYWRSSIVQDISQKNAVNRARQKYIHRMGPTNFARIRTRLRAKKEDGEDVSQAEMFIETCTSRKGKEVDQDTQIAITTLQDSIQSTNVSAGEAFQSLFGKEKPGRVRCLGRIVTPTTLKRNEEMATVKKQHANEMSNMTKKIEGLQAFVKFFVKQVNPDLDDETLDDMMHNAMGTEHSAARSSASTHIPNFEKQNYPGEEDEVQDMEGDE